MAERSALPDRVETALRAMGLHTLSVELGEAEQAVAGFEHHRATAVVDLAAALTAGPAGRTPLLPNNT